MKEEKRGVYLERWLARARAIVGLRMDGNPAAVDGSLFGSVHHGMVDGI